MPAQEGQRRRKPRPRRRASAGRGGGCCSPPVDQPLSEMRDSPRDGTPRGGGGLMPGAMPAMVLAVRTSGGRGLLGDRRRLRPERRNDLAEPRQ